MDVVGTTALAVVDGHAVPRGRWHAIGPDGAPRCRAGVAYRFPALAWAHGGDDAERCEPCAALTGTTAGDAAGVYPDEPSAAVVPLQPQGTGTASYDPAVVEERSVVEAHGC